MKLTTWGTHTHDRTTENIVSDFCTSQSAVSTFTLPRCAANLKDRTLISCREVIESSVHDHVEGMNHLLNFNDFFLSVLSNAAWILIGFSIWRTDTFYKNVFSRGLTRGVDELIERMERHVWSSLRYWAAVIYVGSRLGWWWFCLGSRLRELLFCGCWNLRIFEAGTWKMWGTPKAEVLGRAEMGFGSAPSTVQDTTGFDLRRRQGHSSSGMS